METPRTGEAPDVMALAFRQHAFGEPASAVTQAAAVAGAQAAQDGAAGGGDVARRRVLVLAPLGRDAALAVEALSSAGLSAGAVDGPAELLRAVAEDVAREGPPQLGALLVT